MKQSTWLKFFLSLAVAPGVVPSPPGPSLHIAIHNRVLPAGSEFSFTVRAEGFSESVNRTALVLRFPGLRNAAGPQPDSADGVLFRGRLDRPGVFPFEVSLQAGGKTYSARDYLVALQSGQPSAFDHTGYYVFLGRGDYWDETQKLALWRLRDWQELIDWMAAHHADTLFCLLSGYTLAYPSEKYPSLRDRFSLNARYNFLGTLIDYAHTNHVKVYVTLTTDDHAAGFGKLHPEAVRLNRDGFKTSDRALCLENPQVERYITDIFSEVLDLYPNADGIVIHPTEEDPDRYNDETREAYYRDTGKELTYSSKDERFRWYNETYARFAGKLCSLVTTKRPGMDFIMLNCWWQDDYVPVYKRALPAQARICVWYYGWDDLKYQKWPLYAWTDNFGSERLLYMPTGPAFLYPVDPWQQMERHIGTDRLASAVEASGVRSCIFFAGWDLGTETDRVRDLMLVQFPTGAWASGKEKDEVVRGLYGDYWGTRARVLH